MFAISSFIQGVQKRVAQTFSSGIFKIDSQITHLSTAIKEGNSCTYSQKLSRLFHATKSPQDAANLNLTKKTDQAVATVFIKAPVPPVLTVLSSLLPCVSEIEPQTKASVVLSFSAQAVSQPPVVIVPVAAPIIPELSELEKAVKAEEWDRAYQLLETSSLDAFARVVGPLSTHVRDLDKIWKGLKSRNDHWESDSRFNLLTEAILTRATRDNYDQTYWPIVDTLVQHVPFSVLSKHAIMMQLLWRLEMCADQNTLHRLINALSRRRDRWADNIHFGMHILGDMALDRACQIGVVKPEECARMVTALIAAGAPANGTSEEHYARSWAHYRAQGIDWMPHPPCTIPLYKAVELADPTIAQILVAAGARADRPNRGGNCMGGTPVSYVERHGHPEMRQYFSQLLGRSFTPRNPVEETRGVTLRQLSQYFSPAQMRYFDYQ